jgi:hypothetical protein
MIVYDELKKFENKKIRLYVDMDGVVADYEVGVAANYDQKRPLFSNLGKLEKLSHEPNIELNILSVTRMNEGIVQKNFWLDKYAPFFEKDRRNILSREQFNLEKDAITLKYEFLRDLPRDDSQIVFIDDDPAILRKLNNEFNDILLLKDTTLID